jgi:hypothetical protein
MNPDEVSKDDEMVEKAKQLLLLTDLVDKYPRVVARRVSGLVYILIGGGMSFATLVLMVLQDLVGLGDPFLINVGFVILCLTLAWVIGFRLIVPLTKSYQRHQQDVDDSNLDKGIVAIWAVLGSSIVISAIVLFQIGLEVLFPVALQIIMGCGFSLNYILGQRSKDTDFFSKEHLYFALIILMSIIPMLLWLEAGYLILIITNMGGIFAVGISLLVTAERLLLESKE